MARARCPGEVCEVEGTRKLVENHMRKCSHYAALFAGAGPDTVTDPEVAYRLAHPPPVKTAKTPKVDPEPAPEPEPEAAAGPEPGSGLGSVPAVDQVTEHTPSRRRRVGARLSRRAAIPALTSANPSGQVVAECWDWQPTILEELVADSADGAPDAQDHHTA